MRRNTKKIPTCGQTKPITSPTYKEFLRRKFGLSISKRCSIHLEKGAIDVYVNAPKCIIFCEKLFKCNIVVMGGIYYFTVGSSLHASSGL
ncbi:MAG: hypothetical protein A2W17_06575 [Planctomycetes bacterium RBG_16_41_13]|nr:MAG: hypothetical protein A2W17_06575 [Planctomycetes bacterium RBG_16_41_13]